MNPAIEALCDRYADWLIERYEAGDQPTAYLFDPGTGGNPNANHRVIERLDGRPIPVVWVDKAEWLASEQEFEVARMAGSGP